MDLAIPSGDELDVLLREEAAWRTAAHSAELETAALRSTMTGPPYHPATAAIAEPYPVAETYYRAVPYTAAAQAAETAAARVRWATGQREPPPSVHTLPPLHTHAARPPRRAVPGRDRPDQAHLRAGGHPRRGVMAGAPRAALF